MTQYVELFFQHLTQKGYEGQYNHLNEHQ